jgi:hypothetical protein
MMLPAAINRSDWTWFRMFARLQPGVAVEPVRARLHATFRAFLKERSKGLLAAWPKSRLDQYLNQTLLLTSTAAGISTAQKNNRLPLTALGVLVTLVLLFVRGLFGATLHHLSNQATGFSAERLLTLDTVVAPGAPPVVWREVGEHLRGLATTRRPQPRSSVRLSRSSL